MAEVPDHLLRRSRERREALGLSTGDEGGVAAPAAAPPAPTAPTEEEAAPDEAAVPAPVEAEAPALPAAGPGPVLAPARRVPIWMLPILLALPIWALVYAYALDDTGTAGEQSPLAVGREVYEANCASCHLASGAGDTAGGVGRQLDAGQAELTFPDPADHVAFVGEGSPAAGTPYGNADRPGGQRVARGGMPAWAGTLSDEELTAVVTYEREGLK